MTDAPFQRARSPEAKARRRADILSAARAILDQEGSEAVTLQEIATRAGIVKSNIYRYFESREDILVELLLSDMAEMNDALADMDSADRGAEATARCIADAFVARPRFCLLVSLLAPTLEHNISPERLRAIKLQLLSEQKRAVASVCARCPDLRPDAAAEWTNMVFVLAAGLWPMTHPGPALARVLEAPEFAAFKLPFEDQFHSAALAALRGYIAGSGPDRTG
ncbi:TetR family transcriptional regulator [Oceanomicrobium pacificus]|uniref:TetR family transcriptional regulator n=1 Tax=Oceanomicrobium pacificus TaxID=2692916 RepID=A0A6B0TS27_9RHOB|nr:TetR family transcriptional regulator [Oceanomicrobium pacificus]MXU64538.1 TetR family transcriptional regulator [Oceanomicrobium pacificus]